MNPFRVGPATPAKMAAKRAHERRTASHERIAFRTAAASGRARACRDRPEAQRVGAGLPAAGQAYRRLRRGLDGFGRGQAAASRHLPAQAARERDRDVWQRPRGLRLRSGQSAAEAGTDRSHHARLQRARARDLAGARCGTWRDVGGMPRPAAPRSRRWNLARRRHGFPLRDASLGRAAAGNFRCRLAPHYRYGCRFDLLHLRQHGQAEGRRALASEHGHGRAQRRPVPAERASGSTARSAALQLRLRFQSALDSLQRRRLRRADGLSAAQGCHHADSA